MRMMQKRGNASKEWDMYLPYLCFAYHDSVHTASGFTGCTRAHLPIEGTPDQHHSGDQYPENVSGGIEGAIALHLEKG